MYGEYNQVLYNISSTLEDSNGQIREIIENQQEIISGDKILQTKIDHLEYTNNIYLGTLILFISVIMLVKFLPKKNYRKGWEVSFK